MATLRLILRKHLVDYNGKHAGYEYSTLDVQAPDEMKDAGLEIVGGEWLKSRELGLKIQENWNPESREQKTVADLEVNKNAESQLQVGTEQPPMRYNLPWRK